MKTTALLRSAFTALALSALLAGPVRAAPQGADPQGEVRRDMRMGQILSSREIERRVLPTKPGMQYLGPEYDPTAKAYRLKFIRDGRVVFVDVDARTGDVIGESR